MKNKLFSDMVYPYCYVGKLRLDQAIERLDLTDVDVEFKAFQLHPTSPADYSMPIYDFIRKAYGPGAVLSAGNSDSIDSPAFQRDIVLVLLSEYKEGMSQRQLAERMRISPSTLSVMLDKLEADECLSRGDRLGDKLVKFLTLTEKGTKRAEEVHRQCTVMRENLYRNLTDDEKTELIRLLNKILDSDK